MKIKKVSHKMFNNTENLLFILFFLFLFSLIFVLPHSKLLRKILKEDFFFDSRETHLYKSRENISEFAQCLCYWKCEMTSVCSYQHVSQSLSSSLMNIQYMWAAMREFFWCSVNEKVREWKIIIKNTTRQKKCMYRKSL